MKLKFLLLSFLLPVSVAVAHAQNATATLTGSVSDSSGAVVAGANVRITDAGEGSTRAALSTHAGIFTFTLLKPGSYTLSVSRQGFSSENYEGLNLSVGQTLSLPIRLKVGASSEVITVSASSVDESTSVGTVVNRELIENIPLNGRSFQSLILLAPGTVPTPVSSSRLGQFSVNGQRTDANYFTVDGVSANTGVSVTSNLYGAGGNFAGYNALGGTNSLVTVDALQEFRIQTSGFAPEFGRTPGGQVSLITRSGTNDLHGTMFEYFRNDVLDANNWLSDQQKLKKAPLRQNQFGFTLGGPVFRNKTFFFATYEGLRLRQPQTVVQQVPSAGARQSATGPVQSILNAFPTPVDSSDLGNGLSVRTGTWSNPSSSDVGSIRVDQTLTKRLTLFARYNNAPSTSLARGVGGRPASNLYGSYFTSQNGTLGATYVVTPNLLDDLRFNYSVNGGDLRSTSDNFGGAVPLNPNQVFPSFASPTDNEVQIYLTSDFTQLFSLGKRTHNLQNQSNIVDTLSWNLHGHSFKFGADYRRLAPTLAYAPYDQFVYFDSVKDAIAGNASEAIISTFSGPIDLRFNELSFFAQDTWTASRRLQLTFGVRWEMDRPFSEAKPQLPALMETGTSVQLRPAGSPFWKTKYENFAPRFGFAYRAGGSVANATVIHGGMGVFYDAAASQYVGNALSGFAYPYQTFNDLLNVKYPLIPSVAAAPSPSGGPPPYTIVGFDPQLQLPYAAQFNLGLQQNLGESKTSLLHTSALWGAGCTTQSPRPTQRQQSQPCAKYETAPLLITTPCRLSTGFMLAAS